MNIASRRIERLASHAAPHRRVADSTSPLVRSMASSAGGGAGGSAAGSGGDVGVVNGMALDDLLAALHKCVASEAWGRAVAAARPFASAAQLQDVAARVWWSLGEAAWKDGFAGHGRLGKPVAEQKEAVGAADGSVLAQLREANAQYLDKFGYQCIVYAAGKPMPLVLAVVRARLANDVASELRVAAEQTHLITAMRLQKLMEPAGWEPAPAIAGDQRSPITSHILDTSVGSPAEGVRLRLERAVPVVAGKGPDASAGVKPWEDKAPAVEWLPLASDVTNADGRAVALLPSTHHLVPGDYRIHFDVADYFSRRGCDSFYPTATVAFTVPAADQHYHVPLLLNPFGYSTYRGS